MTLTLRLPNLLEPQEKTEPCILPESLEDVILNITNSIKDIESYAFKNSIYHFKVYLEKKYNEIRFSNKIEAFITDTMISLSYQKLDQNSLLCIYLLDTLTNVNIGDKIIKANIIARDISSIPPISHPIFWKKIRHLILWLQKALTSSFQNILFPIIENTFKWSESGNNELLLSALKMLTIIFDSFSTELDEDIHKCRAIILKGLLSMDAEVEKSACEALQAAIQANFGFPINKICENFMKVFHEKNALYYVGVCQAIKLLLKIDKNYKNYLKFIEIPSETLISADPQLRKAAYTSIPLAYITTPSIFNDKLYCDIVKKFELILQLGNEDREDALQGLTNLIFAKRGNFSENEKMAFQNVISMINSHCNCEMAGSALLAIFTVRPDLFNDNIMTVYELPLSNFLIKSYQLLLEICPQFYDSVCNHMINYVRPVLQGISSEPRLISVCFKAITLLNIVSNYIPLSLCLQFSIHLSHRDYLVRKAACKYIILYHNNSLQNDTFIRIMTIVCTEQKKDLRKYLLTNVNPKPCSDVIINMLRTLIHDKNKNISTPTLNMLASQANYSRSADIMREFMIEKMNILDYSGEIRKDAINVFFTISDTSKRADKETSNQIELILAPFIPPLIKKLCSEDRRLPGIALKFLTSILPGAANDIPLEALLYQITSNLSVQQRDSRICHAVDLLMTSFLYTDILIKYSLEILSHLIIVAKFNKSPKMIKILMHAISRMGSVRPNFLRDSLNFTHKVQKMTPNTFIAISDVTSPKGALKFAAAVVGLMIILDVLSTPKLAERHQIAITALVTILKSYRTIGDLAEETLVERVSKMLEIDSIACNILGSMQTILMSLSTSRVKKLLPSITDAISRTWQPHEPTTFLSLSLWLFFYNREDFIPFLPKLARTFLSDLDSKNADAIFAAFVNLGTAISSISSIVYPRVVDWIELNAAFNKQAYDALIRLKALLINGGSQKYSTMILAGLTRAIRLNPELNDRIVDVIYVIAVQMGPRFLFYIPSLSDFFNLSVNQKLQEFIKLTQEGKPITEEIKNSVRAQSIADKHMKKVPAPRLESPHETQYDISLPRVDFAEIEWSEWMNESFAELTKDSAPRPITACATLAEHYRPMYIALFPLAFAVAASEEESNARKAIDIILKSKTALPSIRSSALDVLEMFELLGNVSFPLDLAVRHCIEEKRYAQAMRYCEYQFEAGVSSSTEELVKMYIRLGLTQSAAGVLKMTQIKCDPEVLERMSRWDDALSEYQHRFELNHEDKEAERGLLRCLWFVGRIDELIKASIVNKKPKLMAVAAWSSFNVEGFKDVVEANQESFIDNTYSILCLIANNLARGRISECRKYIKQLEPVAIKQLFPIIGDDYKREYKDYAQASIIGDFEEACDFLELETEEANDRLKRVWKYKMSMVEDYTEVLASRLFLYVLLFGFNDCEEEFIRYIKSAISHKQYSLSIIALNAMDPDRKKPEFNKLRCVTMWESGKKKEAIRSIKKLNAIGVNKLVGEWYYDVGKYRRSMNSLRTASEESPNDLEVWQFLSRTSITLFEKTGEYQYILQTLSSSLKGLRAGGSISFSNRILTIIFQRTSDAALDMFEQQFKTIPPHMWIDVLPQIIAYIGSPNQRISQIIKDLIMLVGKKHPDPVMYSLLVPLKSGDPERKRLALELFDKLTDIYPDAVNSVIILARELMRVAVTWYELWYSVIGAAYDRDPDEAVLLLEPAHWTTSTATYARKRGMFPQTFLETEFIGRFGTTLERAYELLMQYKTTRDKRYYNNAWSIYLTVFKTTKQKVEELNEVDLSEASLCLLETNKLASISVPGTYEVGKPSPGIHTFSKILPILSSKQRPRRMSITGTDGIVYDFLLKAHEDTRLDERVMQLFTFINTFTTNPSIKLTTYRVTPLTADVGLIGWVPNCSTLSEVICQYREKIDFPRNKESQVSYGYFKDKRYNDLNLDEKVEAFEAGINSTKGDDLGKILLVKASSSSHWVRRRKQYASSLAVTSMIGYIIGLGDRHLGNIMMELSEARLVHIDFGDCFEVLIHDGPTSETVPFRLTRILVNALEAPKIDGVFRATCENVMSMVQKREDQILALLEVFIHDPLLECANDDPNDKAHRSAIETVSRIRDKLRRTDGVSEEPTVESQVDGLIRMATDSQNLCRMFDGWYPWW